MHLLSAWNFLLTSISQPIFGKPLFYWWIIVPLILVWMVILRCIANVLVGKRIITLNKQTLILVFPYFPIIDYPLSICFMYAWINNPLFFPADFLFFSALTITIHTDLQHMLISRIVSLYMIPVGILLSYADLTIISPFESIISALAGYALLFLINKIFYWFKKHDGLGQGDLELLAFIGSFLGLLGCWVTILIGSTLGTFAGCFYMIWTKKTISVMPFGLFLAIGALSFVMFEASIFSYLASNL